MATNKDELYLRHLSDSMNASSQPRITYLGFLVTINIAVYGAISFLDGQQLFFFSGKKLFLAVLLAFINLVVAIMYLREHNIATIRDEQLLDFFKTPKAALANRFEKDLKDKDIMRGMTWVITKLIFSSFSSVPIAYTILLFISPNLAEGEWLREGCFAGAFVVFLIVFELFFCCKEYKRKR